MTSKRRRTYHPNEGRKLGRKLRFGHVEEQQQGLQNLQKKCMIRPGAAGAAMAGDVVRSSEMLMVMQQVACSNRSLDSYLDSQSCRTIQATTSFT